MPERYTPITLSQMRELLKPEKGWVLNRPAPALECFFDRTVKADSKQILFVRVYSSIPGNEMARECGTDAIRVCVCVQIGNRSIGIRKFSRVYRTQGWREHLKERVLAAQEYVRTQLRFCMSCGSVMLIRKAKKGGNEFWGCTAFPICRYTEKLKERD